MKQQISKPTQASGAETAVRPRVQSVARAVSILTTVAQSSDGLRAMEIAERLRLGRQATYHLLHTLVGCGMLTRNRHKRYVLGLRVATLIEAFGRHLAPPEHLAPLVRAVANETGETAYAVGWHDGEIVTLVAAPGRSAVHAVTIPQGYYGHAHARATGKLLLAYAPKETCDEYLRTRRLEKRTPRTLVDRKSLAREFQRIREHGFATDREEFATGLCCLAVPIGGNGATFALGMSAPAERFKVRSQEYLHAMRRIAKTA